MDKRSLLFAPLLLALACRAPAALADESTEGNEHQVARGIHEVGDDELADMRGRYVVGDNTVLWFGVEMVSSWQTSNGQTLQSTLTLGLDFSKNPNHPQVTFVPTVTIATISNALPVAAAARASRSVQSAGLANVSGVTQSVQIAGDGNAAINLTSLNIQHGGNAPTLPSDNAGALANANNSSSPSGTTNITVSGTALNASSATGDTASSTTSDAKPLTTITNGTATTDGRIASAGNASASSTYNRDGAQVNLSVSGLGSASQWIRPGSLGQTIALTGDNQVATNQMIVSMVTQSTNATTSQLAHNLTQSLNMSRNNR